MWTDPTGNVTLVETAVTSLVVALIASAVTYSITGNVVQSVVVGVAAAMVTAYILPSLAIVTGSILTQMGLSAATVSSMWVVAQLNLIRASWTTVAVLLAGDLATKFAIRYPQLTNRVLEMLYGIVNDPTVGKDMADAVDTASVLIEEVEKIANSEE